MLMTVNAFVLLTILLVQVAAQSYYVDTFATVTKARSVRFDATWQTVYIGSGDASGVISTVPATGGTLTTFSTSAPYPMDICLDSSANVYVVKITPAGGAATAVSGLTLGTTYSCVMTNTSSLYVADYGNNRIVLKNAANLVTVIAVSPATTFLSPVRFALDLVGNMYLAECNARISKLSPSMVMTIIAGSATTGYRDGPSTSALFTQIQGMAYDNNNDIIYVAEGTVTGFGSTIRSIKSGQVATIAGLSGTSGFADGNGTVARFNFPQSIALDVSGNILVADYNNNRIRKIYICAGNSTFDVTSKTCSCGAGFEYSSGACSQCPLGKIKALANATSCTSCPTGQVPDTLRTSCIACTAGSSYRNDLTQTCVACPANSVCNSTAFTCNVGYILDAPQTGCVACPANQESNSARTACAACDPVMQYFSNTTKTCLPCLYGTSCNGVSLTCSAGFVKSLNSDGCIACSASQATDPGKTSCVTCANNQFISSSKLCSNCISGATCNGVGFTCNTAYEPTLDGAGCQMCSEGSSKSSSGNVACTQCAAGTESSADKLSCAACGAGKYRPNTTVNKCIPCPPNGACTATTLTCNAGFKVNSNGDGCDQCPIGQESVSGGNCQACQLGAFKPSQDFTTCIACPQTGSSNCVGSSITCQSGYFFDSNVQCKRNDTFFAVQQTGTQSAATVTNYVTLTQTTSVFVTATVAVTGPTQTQPVIQTVTVSATVAVAGGSPANTQTVIATSTQIVTVRTTQAVMGTKTQTVTMTATADNSNSGFGAQLAQSANSVTIDFIGTLPISPLIFGVATFGAGLFVMLLLSLVCCRRSPAARKAEEFDMAVANTALSDQTFSNNTTLKITG